MRGRLLTAVGLSALLAGFAAHAGDSAVDAATVSQVSSNWSGYAVTAPSTTYTSVTGTWVQPTLSCAVGERGTSSAFWVGLGGYDASSQALEQAGTSADCSDRGRPTYYAWYELVPSPSQTIKLKVNPGDTITTSVNVVDGGTSVLFQIKNRTRKTTFTKKVPFSNPDLTSAEWIAEAPSLCNQTRCTPVPLANFSSVSFTKVAALGNGNGGAIANSSWTAHALKPRPARPARPFPRPDGFAAGSGSTAGATPGDPSPDGGSFTVSWLADASAS